MSLRSKIFFIFECRFLSDGSATPLIKTGQRRLSSKNRSSEIEIQKFPAEVQD